MPPQTATRPSVRVPLPQHPHRRLGHHRVAHQVAHLGVGVEGLLDEVALHRLVGVAPAGADDGDPAATDRVTETLVHKGHPAGVPRPGEPGDRHPGLACGGQPGQILADLPPHVVPRHSHLGGEARVGDVVDGGQHRLPAAHLAQQVRQPVEGHRAEDHRVHVGRLGAGLDQAALAREMGVAAGLEHLHAHAEPPGLVDHPVVDRQPVGILEVGHHDAQLPGPAGLGRRGVGLPRRGARIGEGRLPAQDLRSRGRRRRGRQEECREPGRAARRAGTEYGHGSVSVKRRPVRMRRPRIAHPGAVMQNPSLTHAPGSRPFTPARPPRAPSPGSRRSICARG